MGRRERGARMRSRGGEKEEEQEEQEEQEEGKSI